MKAKTWVIFGMLKFVEIVLPIILLNIVVYAAWPRAGQVLACILGGIVGAVLLIATIFGIIEVMERRIIPANIRWAKKLSGEK